MTGTETEKTFGLREEEKTQEKESKTREAEGVPSFSEIEKTLETATEKGVEAGHSVLQGLEGKDSRGIEFPPELKSQIAEIKKDAEGKIRDVDTSIGRMKDRLLSVLNFITGRAFERIGRNNSQVVGEKLFNGHFLNKDKQGISSKERGKLEGSIDMGRVKERAKDVAEYLSDKIKGNDVVLLGEIHTHDCVEKKAAADLLEQAKAAGTTHVGLEIPEYYQEAVNRYMETGKFAETDDPADYEQVEEYHRLFREQLTGGHHPDDTLVEMRQVPTTEKYPKYEAVKPAGMTDEMFAFDQKMWKKKNYVFRNHFDKDYYLLKKIREAGLVPVCIDANATWGCSPELDKAAEAERAGQITAKEVRAKEVELEQQRDDFMMKKIQGVVKGGGKMLAVLGNRHVARTGLDDRQNVADLLGQTEIKAFSINMDRNLDSDAELSFIRGEQPDTSSSNSVLYSAIEKETTLADKSIGFNLDADISKEKSAIPYDGYIRLAK